LRLYVKFVMISLMRAIRRSARRAAATTAHVYVEHAHRSHKPSYNSKRSVILFVSVALICR
jgi:hypothetical protein